MPQTTTEAKLPRLITELPGPEAKRVIELDHEYLSPSYTRSYPLVAKRGRGALVEDVDGNVFLDFSAGIAVVATGHCHPEVVAAIQNQAAELIHMSGTDFYYASMPELARKLAAVAPGPSPKRVYFGNSGTEAVEAAMKLARRHTKREKIVAFYGAFHGRTMGALSLTASRSLQRKGFGALLPSIFHVPYANPYRCPYGAHGGIDKALRRLRSLLSKRSCSAGLSTPKRSPPLLSSRFKAKAATLFRRPSSCSSCKASAAVTAFFSSPTKSRVASAAPENGGPAITPASNPILCASLRALPPACRFRRSLRELTSWIGRRVRTPQPLVAIRSALLPR